MPDNANLKRLYDNMPKYFEGFNVPYEQFSSDMYDETKISKLHENLSNKVDGFNIDFNQFKTDMGYRVKPTIDQASGLPIVTESELFTEKESFLNSINTRLRDITTDREKSVQDYKTIQEDIKSDPQSFARTGVVDPGIKAIEDKYEGLKSFADKSRLSREKLEYIRNKYGKTEPIKDVSKIKAEEEFLTQAKRLLENPEDANQLQAFWEGVKSPLIQDQLTMGVNEFLRYGEVLDASKKAIAGEELTKEDEDLLKAYAQLTEAQSIVDPKLGYNVGQTLSLMVPYMANFALTSGTGTAIKTGTKALLKTSVKSNLLKNAVAYTAGAAAQAPLLTMGYSDYEKRRAGNYEIDDLGNAQYIAESQQGVGEAVWKSYATSFAEVFGEGFGEIGKSFLGKAVTKNGTDGLVKTFKKAAKFDGALWETAEEYITSLTAGALTGEWEELKHLFTVDGFLNVFISSVIMGGAFKASEMPITVRNKSINTKYNNAVNNLDAIEDEDLIRQVKDIGEITDVKEQAEAVSDLQELSPENQSVVLDYIARKKQYDQNNQINESEPDIERLKAEELIDKGLKDKKLWTESNLQKERREKSGELLIGENINGDVFEIVGKTNNDNLFGYTSEGDKIEISPQELIESGRISNDDFNSYTGARNEEQPLVEEIKKQAFKEAKIKEIDDSIEEVIHENGTVQKVVMEDGTELFIKSGNLEAPDNVGIIAYNQQTKEKSFINPTDIRQTDTMDAQELRTQRIFDVLGEIDVADQQLKQDEAQFIEGQTATFNGQKGIITDITNIEEGIGVEFEDGTSEFIKPEDYKNVNVGEVEVKEQPKEREIVLDEETTLKTVENDDGTFTVGDIINDEKEATKLVNKLNSRFANSQFEVVNEIDETDPFAVNQFRVVAKLRVAPVEEVTPIQEEVQLKPDQEIIPVKEDVVEKPVQEEVIEVVDETDYTKEYTPEEKRTILSDRGFKSDDLYMSETQIENAFKPDSEKEFALDVLSSLQDPNSVYDITNFVSVDDAINIVENINNFKAGTEDLKEESRILLDYLENSYKSRTLTEQGMDIDELEEDIAIHKFKQFDGTIQERLPDELRAYAGEFETLDELRRNLSTNDLIKLSNYATKEEIIDTRTEDGERREDVSVADIRRGEEEREAEPIPTETGEVTEVTKQIQEESAKVEIEPTEAQKEAGNYKKGHVKVQGFDITIENPKGSIRSGVDSDGETWETEMFSTYGYFKRTTGKDGDQIDVFLGNNPDNGKIFVIDQVDTKTKAFDEHKVMLGFDNIEAARDGYLANYDEGWQGLGNITEVNLEDFTKWIDKGTRKQKPFADYKEVKAKIEAEPQFVGDILKEKPKKPSQKAIKKQKLATKKIIKEINTQITAIDKKIKEVQSRKTAKKKELEGKKATQQDMFVGEFVGEQKLFDIPKDFTQENIDKALQPFDVEIRKLQSERLRLEESKDKTIKEVAGQKDFIPERPTTPGNELDQWVLDYSDDAQEVHAAWLSQSQLTPLAKLSPLEEDVLTKKVNRDSFIEYSDKANITEGIARNWFAKGDNTNNNIDVIAQELTDEGLEVTPDDIIAIILKFPDGTPRKTTNLQTDLAAKYKKITGESVKKVGKGELVFDETVPFRVKEGQEELTPDRNYLFNSLPDPDKIKTKEEIAEYNAKIEILDKMYKENFLGEDFIDDIEEDWVLQNIGENRYFSEIVEEKLEELDQLEQSDLDSGEEKTEDYLDSTDIPVNLSIEDLVKQSKGTTEDLGEAGYILQDGALLDFSGKRVGGPGGVRYEDHRQLAIPINEDLDPTDLMNAFMRTTGAIRIDYNGGAIDLETKPTVKQLNTIGRIIRDNKDTWTVDLQDGDRRLSLQGGPMELGLDNIERFYTDKTLGTGFRDIIAFKKTENIKAPIEPTSVSEFIEYGDKKQEFINEVQKIADEYSEKLNSKINVIQNASEVPESIITHMKKQKIDPKTIPGVYNPANGEIYLMTDYLDDTDEAKRTILHELVGHKGLRGVLGAEFKNVLNDIYKSMSQEDIDRISKLYNTKNKLVIADEFLAEQAENKNKPNFINRAIANLKTLLRRLFGISYSDNDINNLLAKSVEYLKKTRKDVAEKGVRFKKKPVKKAPEKDKTVTQIAREAINNPNNERTLKEVFNEFRQTVQDKDLPIRDIEREVKKRGGTITDDTKPYRDKNLSFGRVEATWEDYRKEFTQPIYDIIADWKKQFKTQGADVMAYMIAKHAPERNDKIRKDQFEEWKKRNPDASMNKSAKYLSELKNKDFSGVLALNTKDEFKNKPEAFAKQLVDEFEETHDTKEFWKRVNKSTTFVLDRWLEGKQINQDQYNEYQNDYKNYVPLRGWHDAAQKQLDYHTGSGEAKSLKHAEGRTSLPDNPLVYIEQTAFQSIGEQTTNEVNQSMLNLIMENYKGNEDLFRVKKVYYVENPLTGEFEPTLERPTKEMFDSGEAKSDYYSAHQRLRKPSQASEHEVWVNTDNGTFAMVFPDKQLQVAQALNNQNNLVKVLWFKKAMDAGSMNDTFLVRGIGSVVGIMKAMFTSWNIVFPVTNLMRDWPEALTHISVTGDLKQGGTFAKTLFKDSFKTVGTFLYNNKKFNPKTNELHKLFQEFREIGGQTGFTHSKSPEELEKSIEKEIKKSLSGFHLGKVTDQLERFSQLFEDASRFAAYASAIKVGKTQKDAASLAKEATVNFNRKGKLSKVFDSTYAFFNVAVQAAQKNIKIAKDYPVRFATAAAAWTVLGGLMAELNRFLDEDEEYEQISDWVRQNYLVFPLFNGNYLRIPLPQFFRSFYSFGTLISDVAHGDKGTGRALAEASTNLVASLSPIDPGGFIVDGEWSWGPLVPTFYRPAYEITTNRNFMGGRIHKEAFTKQLEKELASARMHKANVSPIIKFMTEALYQAGGGREDSDKVFYRENGEIKEVKGIFDWNPSDVEHLIKGYTGGTGKFVVDLTTTLSQIATPDESVATDNIPYVNAFIKKYPDKKWKVINEYYDIKNKVKDYEITMKTYEGDKAVYYEMKGDKGYNRMLRVVEPTEKRLKKLKDAFDKNRLTTDEYFDKRSEEITKSISEYEKLIHGLERDYKEQLDNAKRSGNKDMIKKIQDKIDKLTKI